MSDPRTYRRLTVAQVAKLARRKTPGMYPDGDGLYLAISKAGVASWSFRYMIGGRAHEMGLRPLRDVSLSRARELAADARQLKREGVDPIDARRAKRQGQAIRRATTPSFKACAIEYITAHRTSWRSSNHAKQWSGSLEAYVFPVIGDLEVDRVDIEAVLRCLKPIWEVTPETARRVRGRIELILDAAKARGYRSGENPARWKGHLENLLAKKSKVAVKHHAALPYGELPEFMAALRQRDDGAARTLHFAILTVARTDEVLGTKWQEFNLDERLWIVPPERMKSGREHRVPLSAAAMVILRQQEAVKQNEFVFPGERGARAGKHTLRRALQSVRPGLTPHGFRSTFADWCTELTDFASETREMALAHAVSDRVEAAYRRGDLFEKRRQLAEAWAQYCARVVPLRRQQPAG